MLIALRQHYRIGLFISALLLAGGLVAYLVIDRGNALYRIVVPATWAEQLAAAQSDAAAQDPRLDLWGVSAVPADSQASGSAMPRLHIDFIFTGVMNFEVSMDDDMPIWSRSSLISDGYLCMCDTRIGIAGLRRALPYVKIGPAEALRLTWADGQEFMTDNPAPRPEIYLLAREDSRWPQELPTDVPAVWSVTYPGASGAKLTQWIDAANGSKLYGEIK